MIVRLSATVLLGLAAFAIQAPAATAASRCGVERWAVKTGTDGDVSSINIFGATVTDIASLVSDPVPGSLAPSSRSAPVETTRWVLDATITEFKLETDADYHLVLRDQDGRSLIAEIPDPTCVADASPLLPGIRSARGAFDARFNTGPGFTAANVQARITGIGFFDTIHGQAGVASNGVEIHPVLSVEFDPTSPLPAPQSPPPAVTHAAGVSTPTAVAAGVLALVLLGGVLLLRRGRPGR